jgi:hypothetical protein
MTRSLAVTCTALIALTLAVANLAAAQSIGGIVRETVSSAPVAGAVVVVYDSAGAATAQAVAGRDGRYSVAVAPQARTVIVRRIGFLPFTAPVPAAARQARATLDVALSVVPRTLAPVTAAAIGCPANPTAAQAFALWEQARAAFLATVVARSTVPARLLTLSYAQEMPEAALYDMTARQPGITKAGSARVATRVGDRSWISARTAEQFATTGYIEMDGMSPVLYGPDADHLLDPEFERSHCFSLANRDALHPGQVGVAFEALRDGPQAVSNIRGVLWMSESPLEVRELVFTYTGRMAAPSNRSGGRLVFRTAENGISIIEQWGLHYPSNAFLAAALNARGGGTMTVSTSDRRVQVIGGSLIGAEWTDGTKVSRPHPAITGIVVDNKTSESVKGAAVKLEADGYEMVTGEEGAYAFNPVMPGRYSVRAVDTLWERYGIERVGATTVDAFEGGRMATAPTIKLSPVMDVVRASSCRTNTLGRGQGVVAVRAVDTTGARTLASFKFASGGTERVFPAGSATSPTQVACGITGGSVTVTATAGALRGSVQIQATGYAAIDTATIVLRRSPGGGR